MTKEELKEAIDFTIVANGKKGITAELLASLLHEIVDASGEGGGSSTGGVENVFTLTLKVPETGDSETGDLITSEPNEANALVRQKLIENIANNNICTVFLGTVIPNDGFNLFTTVSQVSMYAYLDGMLVLLSNEIGELLLNEDGSVTLGVAGSGE